ncbi:MAG: NAD(P)-dependent alcohol dehydrogenase [Myxococcales bacterium]|nr:NAD(P)-dependent alcohol dehydrogenase [Myxococcales bacterium]
MIEASRAYELQGSFGAQNLRPITRAVAAPGPGELLLRMRALSLNYRDLMMIGGAYNPRQPLPLVPLSDGVGEVVAVGPGVEGIAVGERVMPCFAEGWLEGPPERAKLATTLGGPLPGVLCEHRLTPARAVVKAPAHLSDAEAATLPCAAVTAWHALITEGKIKPGDRVLLEGTGGVSIFALQIAVMAGAEVAITSSSSAKLERARALGASLTINYREEPDWGRRARAWAGGEGVDHVVEVGGAGTIEGALKAVRPGGTISVIGVLSGVRQPLLLTPILMQQIRLQGIIVGSRAIFADLCRAFGHQRIQPVVDRTFPFDQVQQALEHLRSGAHFGKVVIEVG